MRIRLISVLMGRRVFPSTVDQRLLLDIVRMIAYRTETRMMQSLRSGPGKGLSALNLLRALLTTHADIIPETQDRIPRVQCLGLGSDACDQSLDPLINERNEFRTKYPGTDLALTYAMARSVDQQLVTEIVLGPVVYGDSVPRKSDLLRRRTSSARPWQEAARVDGEGPFPSFPFHACTPTVLRTRQTERREQMLSPAARLLEQAPTHPNYPTRQRSRNTSPA